MKSVLQKPNFKKAVKRLKPNQKTELDNAVKEILKKPDIGELKIGDLAGVRVYKFKKIKQFTLLAYTETDDAIILLALGSHQNFYQNLKRER